MKLYLFYLIHLIHFHLLDDSNHLNYYFDQIIHHKLNILINCIYINPLFFFIIINNELLILSLAYLNVFYKLNI